MSLYFPLFTIDELQKHNFVCYDCSGHLYTDIFSINKLYHRLWRLYLDVRRDADLPQA